MSNKKEMLEAIIRGVKEVKRDTEITPLDRIAKVLKLRELFNKVNKKVK